MEVNWIIIGIIAVLAIILVVFLIKRNQKDEKNLKKYYNKQHNLEENEYDVNQDDEI